MRTWLPAFLLCLAACSTADGPEDRENQRIAQQQAQQAIQASKEAQAQLEAVQKGLDDLNENVSKAVNALAAARSDDERAAARARLTQLQHDQADLRARVNAAGSAAVGDFPTSECLRDPSKGCLRH